jgi:ATP/maltotriose-dependent transcriptional regulator MalT
MVGCVLGLLTLALGLLHVTNIFVKLGVPDRSSAIVKAREAGLGRHL